MIQSIFTITKESSMIFHPLVMSVMLLLFSIVFTMHYIKRKKCPITLRLVWGSSLTLSIMFVAKVVFEMFFV